MCLLEVPLPRYGRKHIFSGFETNFMAFVVLFLALWNFFVSIRGTVAKIRVKMCVRWLRNWCYGIRPSFFSTLEVFCIDRKYRCQNWRINVCLPVLKPILQHTPFFLALWRCFCVDRRYCCQDTFINVCSPDFKPVLEHSPMFFVALFLYF